MRVRALVVAALVACFAAAVPVEAARPRRAMLPYHYTDRNQHIGGPGADAGHWEEEEAYAFRLRKGENAVSVMVLDDQEGPVRGTVVQIEWTYENGGTKIGRFATHEPFCGRTEAPVPVYPDLQVEIFVQKGACDDGTPSLPTTGDVVVDFHRDIPHPGQG